MAKFSRTRKTPYGKTVKAKKFTPKPLEPSPYIWVAVPIDDYLKIFRKLHAIGVRALIVQRIKEGSVIQGKYFKDALDSDFPPDSAIIRGDKRNRNLEVIGRTDSVGAYHPRSTALNISQRIE